MRRAKLRLLLHLMAIGTLVAIGGSIGCDLIFPYKPGGSKKWVCSAKLEKCSLTHKDITNTISTDIAHGSCYRDGAGNIDFDFWDENDPDSQPGLSPNDRVYCDQKWVVKKVGYPDIRGAHWIVTRFKDRRLNDPSAETNHFMTLAFQDPNLIEAVYLAYDSTATQYPDWLNSPDYEKVDGSITMARPGKGSSEVELKLWQKKDISKPIPSNSYGFPAFPNNDPTMYMVIIKPKVEANCPATATAQADKELWYVGCGDTEADARTAAESRCAAAKTEYQSCAEAVCDPEEECPDQDIVEKTFGLKKNAWSFLRSSEIEFDPQNYPSQAVLTIDNKSYPPVDVSGTLHFEYLLDDFNGLSQMQINSMVLHLAPFITDAGRVSDTVITLLAPVKAECAALFPPWAKPCDDYILAQDSVFVSEFARIGGKKLLTVTQNRYPMTVTIDHASRGFKLTTQSAGQPGGGTFGTNIYANGDKIPVDIDVDVFGHFRNFAPTAVAAESSRSVECAIGVSPKAENAPVTPKPFSSNAAPVMLNSAGSFEVYNDPIPNDAYNWYEDYGLVTERFLRQGAQEVIGPHQLSYGVHSITLVIRDGHGVASQDTFELDVQDTLPPSLSLPGDVFVLPRQPGPVKVSIGQATATDICSAAADIAITNDAPQNGIFPSGVVTPVTWAADDSRGHVSTGVQKVFVFKPPRTSAVGGAELQPFMLQLEEALAFFEEAAAKSEARIAACGDEAACEADSQNLLQGINAVADMLGKLSLPEGAQKLQSDVVAQLQQVEKRLRTSNALIDRSNSAGKEVRRLRGEALKSLQGRTKFMQEARRQLQRLKSQSAR
jgi:hypothetical protein